MTFISLEELIAHKENKFNPPGAIKFGLVVLSLLVAAAIWWHANVG